MVDANELWLTNIYSSLKEEGVWIWKDELELFKRKSGKLLCSDNGYDKIQQIVSNDFLTKTFKKY